MFPCSYPISIGFSIINPPAIGEPHFRKPPYKIQSQTNAFPPPATLLHRGRLFRQRSSAQNADALLVQARQGYVEPWECGANGANAWKINGLWIKVGAISL